MIKAVKKILPLEEDEQKALVYWLKLKGIKHTAVPNSTYTKSWSQKTKNTQMGLCAGLPDLVICLPKELLFIEMKRKPNKPSIDQLDWINRLNDYRGVRAIVCYSFEEAKKEIETSIKNII